MVVRSENIDPMVDNAATCLMLLSKVGKFDDEEGEKKRGFRCKTCMKEFLTFQALGGHRASHTKPNNCSDDSSSLPGSPKKKLKITTSPSSHLCPICGLDFPLGQALGGHMRKHRNEKEKASRALVTHSFLPETTAKVKVTTLKKSSSGKRVACSDLDLGSMESAINTNLELGRTMY